MFLSAEGTHWHEVRTHIENIAFCHSLCPYCICFSYLFRNCSNHGVFQYVPDEILFFYLLFVIPSTYLRALSPCTPWEHGGSWSIAQFIHTFGTKLRRVVSLAQRPLYPRRSSHRYLLSRELEGSQRQSGCFGEQINLLSLAEMDLQFLCRPAINPVTTVTELSRLLLYVYIISFSEFLTTLAFTLHSCSLSSETPIALHPSPKLAPFISHISDVRLVSLSNSKSMDSKD